MVEHITLVSIVALQPSARFSLRLRESGMRAADGLHLNMPIGRCVNSGSRTTARLGPDEWLLLSQRADAPKLMDEITRTLNGQFFSLVDISNRNLAFEVAGSCAREVLNAGCPLDLANAAFPAGAATRTVLGKTEILLMRCGSEAEYRVECWRSFAPYVHSFLLEAAREFQAG